ncbi:DUF1127 domain-containing protein [Ectopseudomonas mendocina]|uniref:DUF1127 domain-containing protein n=1 Tax=Ectopseudomonas mendocina TaxID=300 RepID=A0ABZ2RQQ2_ECTME
MQARLQWEGGLFSAIRDAGKRVLRWWELARQRRQLARLDECALKDLGLSRADVMQESERPFWDDPLSR